MDPLYICKGDNVLLENDREWDVLLKSSKEMTQPCPVLLMSCRILQRLRNSFDDGDGSSQTVADRTNDKAAGGLFKAS